MRIKTISLICAAVLILSLASCVGIGDGALFDDPQTSGDTTASYGRIRTPETFVISDDKLANLNDQAALTCYISSYDSGGNQSARHELTNSNALNMYEYFTEAKYQKPKEENYSAEYKNCIAFTFGEKITPTGAFENESIYVMICDVRVYSDDYVVYTYHIGKTYELAGFLDGAYDRSIAFFETALKSITPEEADAGIKLNCLLVQIEPTVSRAFSVSDFEDIGCIYLLRWEVNDGYFDSRYEYYILYFDSCSREALEEKIANLESRTYVKYASFISTTNDDPSIIYVTITDTSEISVTTDD